VTAPRTVAPGDLGLAELTAWVGGRAAAVDRDEADVREALARLGERDLLGIGAPADGDGRFAEFAELVAALAGECLSTAFSLWGHHMVIEYLARADTGFAAGLLPGLRAGRPVGSSAMAPALRDLAGLEPLPVIATPAPGGFLLDGPIRWASNLYEDAVIVLPARTEDGDRLIVTVRAGTPGLTIAPAPRLLALNATASSSARLDGVFVPDEAVVTRDFASFVQSVRPFFLLTQTAFCLGLAAASLRFAGEAEGTAAAALAPGIGETGDRYGRARDRFTALIRPGADRGSAAELLRLRLEAAEVAQAATRLELAVRGGAGFAMSSPTCRRFREAAFLPVQAPTEGQLRWEIQRFAS